MKKNIILCGLLISLLALLFLSACGDEGKGPPKIPPTYVISGLVVDMMTNPPTGATIEGVTVSTEDGNISTTSDENGFWQLIVPSQPDPFIRTFKASPIPAFNLFDYVPSYTTVPVSIGITEFNLMTVSRLMYNLIIGGPVTGKECLMMGAATGFIRMEYPQLMATMEDVVIEVSPASEVSLKYMPPMDDVAGLIATFTGGDNGMVATGPDGTFLVVVEDATKTTEVTINGKKPGNTFMELEQVTRPGGFMPVGVMDLFYAP